MEEVILKIQRVKGKLSETPIQSIIPLIWNVPRQENLKDYWLPGVGGWGWMGLGNGELLLVGKVILERGETFPKLIVIKVAQL